MSLQDEITDLLASYNTPVSVVRQMALAIGKIERDQLEDYSNRKGISLEEAEKWLAPNLA